MNTLFPLACSEDPKAGRDFYVDLLGFEVVFEADWYVHLRDPANPSVQLAFVARDHESVPEPDRRAAPAGVLVTVEVEDADAVRARAGELGLAIVQELRDEAWGQRHFMTRDPSGLLVDVVKTIPPSAEFADHYLPSA